MAKQTAAKALLEEFSGKLEGLIKQEIKTALAAVVDGQSQVGKRRGRPPKAAKVAAAAGAPVKAKVGRPAGSVSGASAPKPCPVCGTPNKGRRYSYLCESHRTATNLAKFKGKAGKVAAGTVKRGPGRPPKVLADGTVKRGPGRPPKILADGTVKRGPGRPPKVLAPGEVKRGPGRPRKVQPEAAATPAPEIFAAPAPAAEAVQEASA